MLEMSPEQFEESVRETGQIELALMLLDEVMEDMMTEEEFIL